MKLKLFTSVTAAALLLFATGAFAGPFGMGSPTTFLRQFAKDKQHVYIIVSGPNTGDTARTLQNQIYTHPDFHRTRDGVSIVTLADLPKAIESDPKFLEQMRIFLLDNTEMRDKLPESISNLIPILPEQINDHDCVATSVIIRTANQGLAFSIGIAAPDTRRVGMLLAELEKATYDRWADMHPVIHHSLNRVLLFSSQHTNNLLGRWGNIVGDSSVWNDVRFFDASKRPTMTPAELDGCDEAYFQDRSNGDALPPEPAGTFLSTFKVDPTTVVLAKTTLPNGRTMSLISAPNGMLLTNLAALYPNISMLPEHDSHLVKDLRRVGPAMLLVRGSGVNADVCESVRAALAAKMRTQFGIKIDEKILPEFIKSITTDELMRASNTNRLLCRKQYIWVYDITAVNGQKTYETSEREVDQFILDGIIGGNKNRDLTPEEQKLVQYRHDCFYPVSWERNLTSHSQVNVTGTLRLLDLKTVTVVWEHSCNGSAEATNMENSDHVTLAGFLNRPDPLPKPVIQTEPTIAMVNDAVICAGLNGLTALACEAWLPDGTTPGPIQTDQPHPVPSQPTAPSITDVEDNTVMLIKGVGQKITTGSTIRVATVSREIKDPTTGEVRKVKVIQWVNLRVTKVGERTMECVPSTPADEKLIGHVKPGMECRVINTTRVSKPRPLKPHSAGNKGGRARTARK